MDIHFILHLQHTLIFPEPMSPETHTQEQTETERSTQHAEVRSNPTKDNHEMQNISASPAISTEDSHTPHTTPDGIPTWLAAYPFIANRKARQAQEERARLAAPPLSITTNLSSPTGSFSASKPPQETTQSDIETEYPAYAIGNSVRKIVAQRIIAENRTSGAPCTNCRDRGQLCYRGAARQFRKCAFCQTRRGFTKGDCWVEKRGILY